MFAQERAAWQVLRLELARSSAFMVAICLWTLLNLWPVSPFSKHVCVGTLTESLPPCRLQEIDALHEKKAANLTKLQEEAQGKKQKKFGFF